MNNRDEYNFYLDISGTVKSLNDDIYIGCLLFNDKFKKGFKEKFYRNFPSLTSFNKKGSSLKPDKIKEIIKFMNESQLKMALVSLPRHIIKRSYNFIQSETKKINNLTGDIIIRNFEEKLMGLAYFYA